MFLAFPECSFQSNKSDLSELEPHFPSFTASKPQRKSGKDKGIWLEKEREFAFQEISNDQYLQQSCSPICAYRAYLCRTVVIQSLHDCDLQKESQIMIKMMCLRKELTFLSDNWVCSSDVFLPCYRQL